MSLQSNNLHFQSSVTQVSKYYDVTVSHWINSDTFRVYVLFTDCELNIEPYSYDVNYGQTSSGTYFSYLYSLISYTSRTAGNSCAPYNSMPFITSSALSMSPGVKSGNNQFQLSLSNPLDTTITVEYGIVDYLSSSTFTYTILICEHTYPHLGNLSFSFDTYGVGNPVFTDTQYRVSGIFVPSSSKCTVGIPRLAEDELGASMTGNNVTIDSDFLSIDIAQGEQGQTLTYYLYMESF